VKARAKTIATIATAVAMRGKLEPEVCRRLERG
jgi:hypothetical protein